MATNILLFLGIFLVIFLSVMIPIAILWYRSNERIMAEHRERLRRNHEIIMGNISPEETFEYIKKVIHKDRSRK